MSNYTPTVWKNNQVPALNANNLNHLEAGIQQAHVDTSELITGAAKAGRSVIADRAITVDKATQTVVGGMKIWVDQTDPANIIGYIDAR